MDIKITTLSENTTAAFGLLAEWGLSILVEAYGKKVLLDTGYSTSAVHNAHELSIDLGDINTIVLSHGHSDHTGGLRDVLMRMQEQRKSRGRQTDTEIIAHPDVFALKYACREGNERFVGIPCSREELEGLGARFHIATDPVRIHENIWTTGEIPLTTEYEKVASALCVKEGEIMRQDNLADDQALIIKTPAGLVVVLGCAHRGVINTIRHAQKITGVQTVHTVLGGTHLFEASEDQIWLTIAAFKELGIQKLGVSHCTGLKPSVLLAQEFGDTFFFNNTGMKLTIPA